MTKAILHSYKKYVKIFSIVFGALILIPLVGFAIFNFYYSGKIFPGTSVAGINVSGLTQNEASEKISQNILAPNLITLKSQGQVFNLDTKKIDLAYDFSVSAAKAYNLNRTGNVIGDWYQRVDLLLHPKNLPLTVSYNEAELSKFISVVSGQVSVAPVLPSIVLTRPSVTINRGQAGSEVDQNFLLETIRKNLTFANTEELDIPIENIDMSLTQKEAEDLKLRAEKLIDKSLTLTFEFDNFEISDSQILSFLGPRGGFEENKIKGDLIKLTEGINRPPQNPRFAFEGGKVTEFQPALDGVEVQMDSLNTKVISAITQLESKADKNIKVEIPVANTPPQISTDKVNNLGIKELIGRGTSTYFHSIPSRVHNVAVASAKINGTLIAPGETFSFNDSLGDVSAFTGYQQAYIIKDGKTVLGDGGGVCQVSSTLFRAILNGGLPITERQAHAYRVSYYEQGSSPGLDATVYSPSPDLKFKNDTPGHILIQATADTKNYALVFELYGTSDGREAVITKPVVTSVTAPPEDLYQDDPTLPIGTTKQIEHKAWGARVTFNYKVTRNGEELINKTFISNYRPWQAVYLRGTAPAP